MSTLERLEQSVENPPINNGDTRTASFTTLW